MVYFGDCSPGDSWQGLETLLVIMQGQKESCVPSVWREEARVPLGFLRCTGRRLTTAISPPSLSRGLSDRKEPCSSGESSCQCSRTVPAARMSGDCSQSVPGLGSNEGSSPPSEQADPSKLASMRTAGHTEGSREGGAVPPSSPVGSQRLAASAPGRGRGLQQGALCVHGHGPTLAPAVSSGLQ